MMLTSRFSSGIIISGESLSSHRNLLSHGNGLHRTSLLTLHRKKRENANAPKKRVNAGVRASAAQLTVGQTDKEVEVTGTITVKLTVGDFLDDLSLTKPLDEARELLGRSLTLELVSSKLDDMGREKKTVKANAHKVIDMVADEAKYKAEFRVPESFGDIGAVLVENELHEEMFIASIVLEGLPGGGQVNFICNSWVQSKHDNPTKRVFFTDKSYLPLETPEGLRRIREFELNHVRGDGTGERKKYERVYDYDVYNDLGDPDSDTELSRPVLGGKKHPYPRRCRTGRPPTKTESWTESRKGLFYLPRDEVFSEVKQLQFATKTLKSGAHAILPSLEATIKDPSMGFEDFGAIDDLFQEGLKLPKPEGGLALLSIIPRLLKAIDNAGDALLRFEIPEMIQRDMYSWFRDDEFGRQFLAGLNPYSIELLTEWPIASKLDSEIYGPPESLITKELVEEEIKGYATLEEALKEKRLFIVDYHDLFLPYVSTIRELKDTTIYGSRTLLFKNDDDTLKLIAIELTRPRVNEKPQWKQVFRPSSNSTDQWLWTLAKTHVAAQDAGFHELISHWLRTHCCIEPYVIAANRQLSAIHPVYRLLRPHFRYTMEINALARKSLINAGGIVETAFSPHQYSMELSSAVYDKLWRFDNESFPADLIRRGMAVEDQTAKYGLKLTIEDYPFASDGLILWDAIKEWVTAYVNNYYKEAATVQTDTELQAWWTEVRTKGHGDKKDETWWPVLDTNDDLIQVLCTIIWVSSGHHSAVNFGQYTYGGYFPNRPTTARANMPTEEPEGEEYKSFLEKPVSALLKTFPSKLQATKVMVIYDLLSSHSPDEEYIGDKPEESWVKDPVVNAAFSRFKARLIELEAIIDERNKDLNLKNRTGAGTVPYEFLKPFSESGGVTNSISI